MKTLYISDLDGTLMNSSAEISDFSRSCINELTCRGGFFTIATARTAATVKSLLSGVRVNAPAILMNGVATFDVMSGTYEHVEYIPPDAGEYLIDAVLGCGMSGFLYCIDGGLSTYYANADTPNAQAFIDERVRKFKKSFTKVKSFDECRGMKAVYYSISDKKERLSDFAALLSKCPGLRLEFYRDIYCEDFWYLEACSVNASKYNALMRLRREHGFDRVVSFGDNLNDIPLFEASDESYAVENAKNEVKSAADGVIASNDRDGVVRTVINMEKHRFEGGSDGT